MKRKFDNHPILWQLLDLISEGAKCKLGTVQVYSVLHCHVLFSPDPQGMWTVAAIIRSLLTVLVQFWQRCRAGKTTAFPRELEGSTTLIECLGQVCVRLWTLQHSYTHTHTHNIFSVELFAATVNVAMGVGGSFVPRLSPLFQDRGAWE